VISDDEERLYLFAASRPLQDFATVMIDIGMRTKELAGIEKKNVFLDKNYLFNPFGKTNAAKRKIPLTERITLKTLLRHSSLNMVTRYAHPTERHQFDAIKQMEAARLKKVFQKQQKCGKSLQLSLHRTF
jgi:hypothetical protein